MSVGDSGAPTGASVERDTYPYGVQRTVAANTPANQPETATISFDSPKRILQLTIGFQGGADHLVGVKIQKATGERLAPRNDRVEYLTGDGDTYNYPLNASVSSGEEIEIRFANLDTDDQFVNIVVTAEDRGGV